MPASRHAAGLRESFYHEESRCRIMRKSNTRTASSAPWSLSGGTGFCPQVEVLAHRAVFPVSIAPLMGEPGVGEDRQVREPLQPHLAPPITDDGGIRWIRHATEHVGGPGEAREHRQHGRSDVHVAGPSILDAHRVRSGEKTLEVDTAPCSLLREILALLFARSDHVTGACLQAVDGAQVIQTQYYNIRTEGVYRVRIHQFIGVHRGRGPRDR